MPKTKTNRSAARTPNVAGFASEREEVIDRREIDSVAREPGYPIFGRGAASGLFRVRRE